MIEILSLFSSYKTFLKQVNRIWLDYREHQRKCKKAFRQAKWAYLNKFVTGSLEGKNSKPFWKYVKAKKEENIGVSPLKSHGQLISDSEKKANILVNQFSSVFTRDDCDSPSLTKSAYCMDDIVITVAGVLKLLQDINVNKAMGPDSIPNKVLKECASELSHGIAKLFQYSLDTGTLPLDWRNANITPVFKKRNRHLPENYRCNQ